MKVEIFTSEQPEGLQLKLNRWLDERDYISVHDIRYAIGANSIGRVYSAMVWYNEKTRRYGLEVNQLVLYAGKLCKIEGINEEGEVVLLVPSSPGAPGNISDTPALKLEVGKGEVVHLKRHLPEEAYNAQVGLWNHDYPGTFAI